MPQYKNPETILVAEDEVELRTLVQMILMESGYTIIVAADGADALAKARAHQGTIDLLLSDIEMPSKSGIEVASHFAVERPETKILLMSGCPPALTAANHKWNLIPKPFTTETLKGKVRAALAHD